MIKRFTRLIFGLFLFALGTSLVIRGNLGYGPWEVFQAGIANLLPLTIGQATVLVSMALVVLVILLKEKIGIGTLANMVLIGVFLDLILVAGIVPSVHGLFSGLALVVAGLFTTSVGSYFYISSGFGAGPRDSLMVAIRRRTSLPVGLCRSLLECLVAGLGWMLGGPLGAGTVITAFGLGICIQIVFRLFSFEATAVQHESLAATFRGHPAEKEKKEEGSNPDM